MHAIAPVVRQAAGVAFRGTRSAPEPASDLWFVNTCQAWREHGPLHTRLLANDVEGLRSLSAHRLAQGPGGRGVDTGAPRT